MSATQEEDITVPTGTCPHSAGSADASEVVIFNYIVTTSLHLPARFRGSGRGMDGTQE